MKKMIASMRNMIRMLRLILLSELITGGGGGGGGTGNGNGIGEEKSPPLMLSCKTQSMFWYWQRHKD